MRRMGGRTGLAKTRRAHQGLAGTEHPKIAGAIGSCHTGLSCQALPPKHDGGLAESIAWTLERAGPAGACSVGPAGSTPAPPFCGSTPGSRAPTPAEPQPFPSRKKTRSIKLYKTFGRHQTPDRAVPELGIGNAWEPRPRAVTGRSTHRSGRRTGLPQAPPTPLFPWFPKHKATFDRGMGCHGAGAVGGARRWVCAAHLLFTHPGGGGPANADFENPRLRLARTPAGSVQLRTHRHRSRHKQRIPCMHHMH